LGGFFFSLNGHDKFNNSERRYFRHRSSFFWVAGMKNRTNFSFLFLNITQFLGALNDNIFKLLVIYFLIDKEGVENAPAILSLAGALYVIPFLLFSSAAGILADRVSKRTVIVSMKIFEFLIMSLSIVSIYLHGTLWLYLLLFLLATHSTFFGPSKYGIIPEIVDSKNVFKANGNLTSLTFLAIILGTFLASFLTDISHKNFLVVSFTCCFFSLLGLISSFQIQKTPPQGSLRRINPFFLYEIYKTLKMSAQTPHLLSSIFGSAFFLFIGGFVQLNIIPFAIQSLHLSEVDGGYLFLATAIGIALGSFIAGKLSKEEANLALSCLSGFFLAFFLLLLFVFSHFFYVVIVLLVLLGLFGGLYLIPFDTFLQVKSQDSQRGQIIASSNFLSFCGVLLASLSLYFFSGVLHCTAASGFGWMALIVLLFNLVLTGRMSHLFFSFLSQKIVHMIYRPQIEKGPSSDTLLLLPKSSWLFPLLLFSFLSHLKIIIYKESYLRFPVLNLFFNNIFISHSMHSVLKKAKKIKQNGDFVVVWMAEGGYLQRWKETWENEDHAPFSGWQIIQHRKEAWTFSRFFPRKKVSFFFYP
jgi:acyl-[acyl-carrier-protein]-phospholipid O-acyltransferase / long-chain-fatty-acid--[acyl-carrier-protein] ligase